MSLQRPEKPLGLRSLPKLLDIPCITSVLLAMALHVSASYDPIALNQLMLADCQSSKVQTVISEIIYQDWSPQLR